jgi:hypothetical protein
MNIRRLSLDVDTAIAGPGIVAIAQAIDVVQGVQSLNVTVSEIDLETIGTDVTVEGENIDHEALRKAIEAAGAVVHSIDHIVAGDSVLESVARVR